MSNWRRRFLPLLLITLLTLGAVGGAASAGSERDALFARVRSVFEIVEARHKDGADLNTFVRGAVRGGLEALGDPYTNYFEPDEFKAFLESLEGSFTGIGAYLDQEGAYVIVSAPVKGAPAARAGLKTGDRILEVNGEPLVNATTEKAQRLIRGPEGTPVTLKIERPSEERTFTVTITREEIVLPSAEWELKEQGVGYIHLLSFNDEAVRGFNDAVKELKAQGATSLVLDLRQNPGGYVNSAVSIASAFVPKGEPIMWEVTKDETTSQVSSGKLIDLPTAVLVDGGSASAAEILAGAIQDYKAAPLIGTQTFGKGTVQQILYLMDGGGMKVTIAEYLTAQKRHVNGKGLTPDYVVENSPLDENLVKPMKATRVITTGQVGLDVLNMQQRLAFLGYQPDLDGYFSGKTKQAVLSFTQHYKLNQVDVVDAPFIETLNAQVAAKAAKQEPDDLQLKKAIEILTQPK